MKNPTPIFAIALATFFTSCVKPPEVYSICFRGSSNEILATGTMNIREPVPPEGKARGTFTLKVHDVPRTKKEIDRFFRLIGNGAHGEVEWTTGSNQPRDWRNTFDFKPGWADAKIGAVVPELSNGNATGHWSSDTIAGGFAGGQLELKKQ